MRRQGHDGAAWTWDDVTPALKIGGALGGMLLMLNAAARWRAENGPTLPWRVFALSGVLLSGWALVSRVKRRPAIDPESRLAAALPVGLAGLSAYALYCVGVEILSSSLSGLAAISIAITAALVIGNHELERRSLGASAQPVPVPVALALLLVCVLAWIETGHLVFWGPYSGWISGDNAPSWKAIFFCSLPPVLLLWDLPRSAGPRRYGLWAFDILAVIVFFIFAFEKDMVLNGGGDFNYPVYTAPAEYIRSGGHLLWDVPSQYGFINILLVAMLPFKAPEALYLVNSALIFLGTLISYAAFRLAWPALGAPLVGIPLLVATSIFFPGHAPGLYSPQLFPSSGPFRYLVCYLLILLLLLQQAPGWKERLPVKRVMRLGGGIWLLGCLWSAESLAYCTAIWLPALMLLDGQARQEDRSESPWRAFVHSAGLLRLPALLLGGAAAVLTLIYLFKIGHRPDFAGYFDYCLAFKNGFTAPTAPGGAGHWLLLFFLSNFLILMFAVEPAQKPLAAAALFCSWGVSSYYASISAPAALLGLCQFHLLAIHITIFILRGSPLRGEWDLFARSAARAVAFAFTAAFLTVCYHDPAAVGRRALASLKAMPRPFSTPSQLRLDGSPEPASEFTSEYSRSLRSSLAALLRKEFKQDEARCVLSLQSYWDNDPERQELWTPFLSDALIFPLSVEVRTKYFDRFMARAELRAPGAKCPERWLAYHDSENSLPFHNRPEENSQWKLDYLRKTLRVEKEIKSGGWHLVKLSAPVLAR